MQSMNLEPTYHLCPSFQIAPPGRGHLELGTLMVDIDLNGIHNPRNGGGALVTVPRELIFPTLSEEAERILTRDFIPTDAYMDAVLAQPDGQPNVDRRGRKQPLYMITGIMVAAGFSMSKDKGSKTQAGPQGLASDPTGGVGVGAGVQYMNQDVASVASKSSSDIVLGFRLRKIHWVGDERKFEDQVVGRALCHSGTARKPDLREGREVIDDFKVDEGSDRAVFELGSGLGGIEASTWVLP